MRGMRKADHAGVWEISLAAGRDQSEELRGKDALHRVHEEIQRRKGEKE